MRAFGLLAGARRHETGIKLGARRGLGWRARLFVAHSVAAPLRAQGALSEGAKRRGGWSVRCRKPRSSGVVGVVETPSVDEDQ